MCSAKMACSNPLTKAVLERAVQAELTHHLGYDKHDPAGKNTGNSRNGKSKKTLKGEFGTLPIEVPRDRNSTFEPQIVPFRADPL
jgi:putative transposase